MEIILLVVLDAAAMAVGGIGLYRGWFDGRQIPES